MPRKAGRPSPFERPTRPDQLPPPPPPAVASAPPPALDPERPPPAVRLLAPFAYLDEAGVMHGWLPGQIVGDAGVVAELIRRGAPLGAIEGRAHVGEDLP